MRNCKTYTYIIVVIFFILNFAPNIFAAKLVPSFPDSSALQPMPINVYPSAHNINIDANDQNNNSVGQSIPQGTANNANITESSLFESVTMNVVWLIFVLIVLIGIFIWLRLHKRHSL